MLSQDSTVWELTLAQKQISALPNNRNHDGVVNEGAENCSEDLGAAKIESET